MQYLHNLYQPDKDIVLFDSADRSLQINTHLMNGNSSSGFGVKYAQNDSAYSGQGKQDLMSGDRGLEQYTLQIMRRKCARI